MRLVWTQKRMARRLACWTLSKIECSLACVLFLLHARRKYTSAPKMDCHWWSLWATRALSFKIVLCVWIFLHFSIYVYIYVYVYIYIHVIIHVSFTICKMMQHSELQNKIRMNACHWVQHCSCFGGMPWILQGTRYPCVQAKDAVVSEVWGRGVHVLQLDLANEFPRNLWWDISREQGTVQGQSLMRMQENEFLTDLSRAAHFGERSLLSRKLRSSFRCLYARIACSHSILFCVTQFAKLSGFLFGTLVGINSRRWRICCACQHRCWARWSHPQTCHSQSSA